MCIGHSTLTFAVLVGRCCYGTGIESFSKLADSIYFTEAATGALIVARYVNSRLAPSRKHGLGVVATASIASTGKATILVESVGTLAGGRATIAGGAAMGAGSCQDKSYGECGPMPWGVNLTCCPGTICEPAQLDQHLPPVCVPITRSTPLSVKLLIPSWAKSPAVRVNGLPSTALPIPGSFLEIKREWAVGDQIEITLPCAVALSRVDDDRAAYRTMYSFVWGDTLLVGIVAPSATISDVLHIPTGVAPDDWVQTAVKRVESAALRFVASASDGSFVELMPLNEVVDERYTVYYNLTDSPAHK